MSKYKDPEGGLTEAGRRKFERSGESKDLKPGVKASGEEVEVELDELIKGYQQGTDYTKKSQALAEQRKAIEAERSHLE